MTTKPKAKRFRIRRAQGVNDKIAVGRAVAPEENDNAAEPLGETAPAKESAPTKTKNAPKKEAASAESIAVEIDAIRKEGLTGRQLRMARRLAQKHGLAPTSDFDAVRLLRNAGIDPFERANMLELVVAEPKDKEQANLPKVIAPGGTGTALSTEVADASARHTREISDIQKDIARRRRKNLAALTLRLCAFVLLPTLVAGWYFFVVATPMYATKSEFVIQQADGGGGGGFGSLLSGTGMATSQDSITVQGYLESREAMNRLDDDQGFKTHFQNPEIDAVQRLDPDATNETAYDLFRTKVKIGYDPTEGLVRMEVIAADPETSAAFSKALIGYAEEQVDNLTSRLRSDQMEGANSIFADAETKMTAAQQEVLRLQEQLGILDPVSESSSLMGQISQFEVQLAEKRLQLQQLLDNAAPNQARVAGVEGDIARLGTLIAELRSQLTVGETGSESLAQVSGQLRMAEVDLETRTLMMQEALQQLETARTEANRQTRYLSLSVNPVPPDEATYPRAFENTLLTALIFAGIYLMISLTVSILREQVGG